MCSAAADSGGMRNDKGKMLQELFWEWNGEEQWSGAWWLDPLQTEANGILKKLEGFWDIRKGSIKGE